MNCPKCGALLNMADAFCQNCGCPISNQIGNNYIGIDNSQNMNQVNINQPQKVKNTIPFHNDNENYVTGFLGAILGSIIGMICMIVFFNLGYVSAVAGIVMAVCTIYLYKKFAKGISKEGIIISILVMVLGVFLAYNTAVAISLKSALKEMGFEVSFFKVLVAIPKLIKEKYFPYGQYLLNLGLLYLFTFAGAVGIIKKTISSL